MANSSGNQGGVWTNSQNNPYPQSPLLDEQTKRPTRAWQQFFLGILNFTSAPSATTGQAGITLPANPVGFINITVDGQPYKVPYYNP
jgi:hypothetical protein